jgi:hypothetical protein
MKGGFKPMEKLESYQSFKAFEQKQLEKIAALEEQKIEVNRDLINNLRGYETAIMDMEPVDDFLSERDRLERLSVSLEDQIKLMNRMRRHSPKIKDLASKAVSDLQEDINLKNAEYVNLLSELEEMKKAYINVLASELKPVMVEIANLRRKAMDAAQYIRGSKGEITWIPTPIDQLQPSRRIAPFFFNNDHIALAVSGYDNS